MPPVACAVSVIDCPVSMVGVGGEMALATSVGLTVIVSAELQVEPTGVPCDESVTLYEYVVVDVGEAR